jgi:ATP-dependent phosphoenolpyruvate carboxykinase
MPTETVERYFLTCFLALWPGTAAAAEEPERNFLTCFSALWPGKAAAVKQKGG